MAEKVWFRLEKICFCRKIVGIKVEKNGKNGWGGKRRSARSKVAGARMEVGLARVGVGIGRPGAELFPPFAVICGELPEKSASNPVFADIFAGFLYLCGGLSAHRPSPLLCLREEIQAVQTWFRADRSRLIRRFRGPASSSGASPAAWRSWSFRSSECSSAWSRRCPRSSCPPGRC